MTAKNMQLPIPNSSDPSEIMRVMRIWASRIGEGANGGGGSTTIIQQGSGSGTGAPGTGPGNSNTASSTSDYLSASEKVFYKTRWDVILVEEPLLVIQAAAAIPSISTTAYVTAYNGLSNFLNDIPGNVYTVNGTQFPTASWNTLDNIPKYLGPGGKVNWIARWAAYDSALNVVRTALSAAGIDPGIPTETFRPKLMWDFTDVDPLGFTPVGLSTAAVAAPDDKTARNWSALTAGVVGQFTGFTIAGTAGYIVEARVRWNSGTWLGKCYYSMGGTTYTAYKTIAAPKVGVWQIVAFDLRAMTSGTSITGQAVIMGYELELGATAGNVDVDWVAAGSYGAGSRLDYDLALQQSITDLLAAGDTTVLGNTVVTNTTNMIPNANSDINPASLGVNTYGAIGVDFTGVGYGGTTGCRKVTLARSAYTITPKFAVTPGDTYYISAFLKMSVGAGGSVYFEPIFDSGSAAGVSTSSSTWNQQGGQFTVPAGATWMQIELRNVSSGTGWVDSMVMRKAADAWLFVNGAIEAYFAQIGGIQTYMLAVGPYLQFKATATGPRLAGRPDGSMTRGTLAERYNLLENINDPAAYIDDSRVYPSGDLVTYETRWGGTTDPRGIFLNLSAGPFATYGSYGLLVKWSGSAISVYGVNGIGTYTVSPLVSAFTVAAATTADDKLTVIYYKDLQTNTSGVANIRLRCLVNGAPAFTMTDTDLGSYGGVQGGYAGLYMGGNVRVTSPAFGRGFVTIQDGAVTADKLAAELAIVTVVRSSTYNGNATTVCTNGFKISGVLYAAKATDGTTPSVSAEFGGDVLIAGWKAQTMADRLFNATVSRSEYVGTTGVTGITSQMVGQGAYFTPGSSGKVMFIITGTAFTNTATQAAQLIPRYGTGTAPGANAAVAGTAATRARFVNSYTAFAEVGFAFAGIISGLTVGVTYWIDLAMGMASSGTATVSLYDGIDTTITEL